MMRAMKICIITPFFDPWIIGGAEKYATTLALALSKNHEVIVITTAGPKPRITSRSDSNPKIFEIKPKNIASRYDMAINSLSVGITKKLLWHFLELWNLSAYSQIAKILNKEKPEIIHTHGVRGFSPALFSAITNSRIPHI